MDRQAPATARKTSRVRTGEGAAIAGCPPLPREQRVTGPPKTRLLPHHPAGSRREVSPALPAAPAAWGPRGAYLAAEHLQRIRVTDQPEAPVPRPALLAQVEKDDGGQRRVGQSLCLRVAAARLPGPRPRVAPGPGQVIKADEILGSARLRILLGRSWSIFVHPPAGGPGGAGATRGEPVGRLDWRGHGGAGGLGAAAGRLQCRGAMAGRATVSPPAGAGPPPSSCPAVCGLRSSSSPCLRGPEPAESRAGRRRRGGPRCRYWPPTGGAGRPQRLCLSPLLPNICPGRGDAPRRPGDGRRRRMLPRRPRRAERSAQLDLSLQLQVPAPPPPAANGGSPAAPQRLPIGCRPCPSGGTAGRAARSPAGLDGAHPPGLRGRAPPALRECRGTTGTRSTERWGRGRAGKPHAAIGGGNLQWDTAASGEGEAAGSREGEMRRGQSARRGLSCGREERQESKASRAKVPRELQETLWSPPEHCLSLARDPRLLRVPRSCFLPRPPAPPESGHRAIGPGACGSRFGVPLSQSPAARQRSPRPEPIAPGLTGDKSPASSWQRGSAPRRGAAVTPQPWEQPVPPARRTRPELPLAVRVWPRRRGQRRQRPGGQAGGHTAPNEGHGPLGASSRHRIRHSPSGTRVKDFLPAPRILTSPD